MVKKRVSKKRTKKNVSGKIEDKLVQNMVELQKLHVNLAERFDKLTDQVGNLLALFENSARTFAKNPGLDMVSKDQEFLQKIDRLLEQNKVLAKGLTLMESKLRERMYGTHIGEDISTGTNL
ncbi:hypothetical protein AUJ84_01785 [Candidatus Pacearchaeota archaeon CG1_02_32_132]|nr:MAG: hypothetical protein AUJ84_01785 [Candidatus Pacearchaeota archaeon CG1_02_32_132]